MRFGLWYDFSTTSVTRQWRRPSNRLCGEILDQIACAENDGFDDVWLPEHQCIDDGYLPWMQLPAASASRWSSQGLAPGGAVTTLRDYVSTVPVTHYYSSTLPPRLPPGRAESHLELFVSKTISVFR
jgi:hypothetical protein